MTDADGVETRAIRADSRYSAGAGMGGRLQDQTLPVQIRLLESAVSRSHDMVVITAALTPEKSGHRIIYVNSAFETLTGYSSEEVFGRSAAFLQGPQTDRRSLEIISAAVAAVRPARTELVNYTRSGEPFWIDLEITPVVDDTGMCTHWVAVGSDVSRRRQLDRLRAAETEILELISSRTELSTVLARVASATETLCAEVFASILLVDRETGLLVDGASPRLPAEYIRSIGSIEKGPAAGSCGTAAHRKRPVIVSDIANDPLWVRFREPALKHGFAACWSTPVLTADRTVLATFALYYRSIREPSKSEIFVVGRLAHLLGLAIEQGYKDLALRESERRFLQIARNSRDVFWIADKQGREVRFVSPAYELIWGRPAADVYANPRAWLDSVHPDDLPEVVEAVTAKRRGEPYQAEFRVVRPDGSIRWVKDSGYPVRDEQGEVYRYVGTAQDTTDRMNALEAARQSEERFRVATQATSGVVWDWDLVSGAGWWSDGLQVLFGHEAGPTGSLVEGWSRRIHEDDRQRVLDGIHATIDSGGTSWTDEYRLIRADGKYAQVVDRGSVIRDQAGQAVRMIGSMSDVTAERALEARLQQSQRLEAIGQLTGGVAHDFNNLLTVILGNSEILASSLGDLPHLARLADMSRKAAGRGADLTMRLLAFARKQPLNPAPTDVGLLLNGMDSLLRRTLGEQMDIRIHTAPDLDDALVDAAQLENAVLNLAINARDAMPSGGRLTISAGWRSVDEETCVNSVTPGRYISIVVADTGTGMTPDVAAKAFDPFFTTKDVGRGTGLGLSMVYGFARQSMGHAKIVTEPGCGTTVTLLLPPADGANAAYSAPERGAAGRFQAGSVAAGGSETILLVEDDDLVRSQASTQLESMGYRVVSAATGREALRVLEENSDVALLFTDVIMPGGMNGRDLADEVRRRFPKMPVLFTSGYPQDVIARQGRLDPDVRLLNKPYCRRDLAIAIRRIMSGDDQIYQNRSRAWSNKE